MVTSWIVNKLDGSDYFYVCTKDNSFNISGKVELHSLNNESYHCTGRWNCILYVLGSRLEVLGWYIMDKISENEHRKAVSHEN